MSGEYYLRMITPYVRVTFATAKVVLLVGCSKWITLLRE